MWDIIFKTFWDNFDPIKDITLLIIALIGAVPQINKLIINKPNLIIKDPKFFVANEDRLYFSFKLRNENKWHGRTSDAVNLWEWTSLVSKDGDGGTSYGETGVIILIPDTEIPKKEYMKRIGRFKKSKAPYTFHIAYGTNDFKYYLRKSFVIPEKYITED